MMKPTRFLIYLSFLMVMAFQNCGQVNVELAPQPSVRPFAAVNMSAEACVNSVKMAPEKTKFIFVIDLSRSNMGDFIKADYVFNGVTYPNYSYWRSALATDTTGSRYDAIANFVSTCGNSANADYSVIAFSNGSGEIAKDANGNHTLACKNRFISSADVASQLSIMKEAQVKEAAYYKTIEDSMLPFNQQQANYVKAFVFKETNYVAATDCLASTIDADMSLPQNETSNYQVFFMSDGEAQAKDSGCEATTVVNKTQCYISKMDAKLSYLMKLSAATSKPIRIHALYYTREGTQNLSIESYMNYLASVGQTSAPINLGSFQAVDATQENPFCKLLTVDKSIVYRTNKIYAVNLTSKKMGPVLKSDTDSDGIIDDDEASYGGNPNDAHSLVPGVLDGVCRIVGSQSLCLAEKNKITCDATKINKLGISDCDIKLLKLDKLAVRPELAGIDSDNDGIPDFVEILKGTDPINPDSYMDLDSDGLNNLQEINAGLDPFTPDEQSEKIIKNDSYFKDLIDQCTSGGWHLDIPELGGPNGLNKLMLFFRTESKNMPGVFEYRIYNTSYEVTFDPSSSFSIFMPEADVTPDMFQLVTPEVSQ